MLDWCSVCEKAIPPQKHTFNVPPSDSSTLQDLSDTASTVNDSKRASTSQQVLPAAQAKPPNNAQTTKSTKRGTQHRAATGHTKAALRKASAKANEKDKEKVAGEVKGVGKPSNDQVADSAASSGIPPNTGTRQRTVISQEPTALYCSEECRLKDEARNNFLLLSQQQTNPLVPQWNNQPSLPSLYQSPSHQHPAYGYPSSPTSPPRLSNPAIHPGQPTMADWEAVNNDYFQRAFDPNAQYSQHFSEIEDSPETNESRYRALLKATADPCIPLPQLQHSLSTTRLTQLAAAKAPPTNRTLSDTVAVVSATKGTPGGVGPTATSSSDSVPSLSEDSHTTKADVAADQAHQKQYISPVVPPTTPPSQQPRPAFLQMTALPSPPPTRRDNTKIKTKSGLTPSASQTNIPAMSATQAFMPGSAPAVTGSEMPTRVHPYPGHMQAQPSMHYGGVTTLDLYAVGYPLAFEPSHSRAPQGSRTGSQTVISKPHVGPGYFSGEQITPTQSLLLPSTSRRGGPRSQRRNSAGSGSSSSRHEDDGLVMKKRVQRRPSSQRSSPEKPQFNEGDGFDTSTGVLVRKVAAFPVAISASAPKRSHNGTPNSFTGERDRTIMAQPDQFYRSSSKHSRKSQSSAHSLHALEEGEPVGDVGSRSRSRPQHHRVASHSSSYHRYGSSVHHPPLSASPLSISQLPSDADHAPRPARRSPSRLSESHVPSAYDIPIPDRPALRRFSSNSSRPSPASSHIATLTGPRPAGNTENGGWGWAGISGRLRSITGLLQADSGDRKPIPDKPASDPPATSDGSKDPPPDSPVEERGRKPGQLSSTRLAASAIEAEASSTPRRSGSIGAGLANLLGSWGRGMTNANATNPAPPKPTDKAEATDESNEVPQQEPEQPSTDLPFSLSTADLPRAKKPLAPLKVERPNDSSVVVDQRTSPNITTSPIRGTSGRRSSTSPLTPATAGQLDHDGPQLIMPRSNWDPELVAKVKRERRLSREGAHHHPQYHHHHHHPRRSSGFTSPLFGRDGFERSVSPPPTPPSTGKTSNGQFNVQSHTQYNPPDSAPLPRTKSNHSVSSMATTQYSHAPSDRRQATILPRGNSLTSLSQAAGKGPSTGGLYSGYHTPTHHDGHAHVTKSAMKTTHSQQYVNRWFSTSPSAGGSAFGSPSARGMYHPAETEHPNGGLPAPPPNIYATTPGVAGQYGPVKKKKEKELVPQYPLLTLPTGTRKKLIWTTIKLADGTEEAVQVEGEEEEEVYPERKRLFFFDG